MASRLERGPLTRAVGQLCGKDVDEKSVDFYVRVRCCAACLANECGSPSLRSWESLGTDLFVGRARRLKTVEALHDDYFHLHPKTFDCAFRSPSAFPSCV